MFTVKISMTRSLRALAAILGLALVHAAQATVPTNTVFPAGDALRGKTLYDTPATGVGPSCGNSSCHGPAVNQAKSLSKGNNKPAVINLAILNGKMTNAWLLAMNAQQLADVAAFTANPGVTAGTLTATVSAASLAFAATTVGGTSPVQSVTLSNTGTTALSLTSIASNSTLFRISGGTCAAGGSIAAGANCTVTMTFNPAAAGAASGTLTFTHNANPATNTVALSGTGIAAAAPIAGAAPATLTFASTTVGVTTAAQTVTLSNTGNAALALSAIASSSPAFVVSGGSCASGGSVSAGSNCTVMLSFKPTAAGAASGTLTFSHNASPNISTVALSGTGAAAAPIASLTPSALSFAQVLASTSSNQTVTLSNTGLAPLAISTIGIGGAQASEFARAAASTCANGGSIAPGASCSVLINFTPTAAGARSASLSIAHNATGSPSLVTLSGTGTSTPQPVISVNNNVLAFADQPLASTSAAQTVTVTNSGQAPLVLSSAALAGANSGDYVLGGTCAANLSIAVNSNCSLTVRFAPTALGARTASIAIASNASPVAISLNGTAVAAPAPAVMLAPASQAFGTATVGAAPVSRTVTLTNSGTATLNLSSVTVTGTGFSGTHN